MKIDLHCHTHKIKRGDPETREVSTKVFAEKIANADVKIVAITNHNSFDKQQYTEFRNAVSDYCDVWPGIEIDTLGQCKKNGECQRFHLIVISNPSSVNLFDERIKQLFQGFDVNSDALTLDEVCQGFGCLDVLFIAHYYQKKPSISDADLLELKEKVEDPSRVFTETTESSIGVLVNYNYHALVGSDVQDWAVYEESTFSDLRLPVSSFEQFCRLAQRDVVVIDTILNKKRSYQFKAKPHPKVSFQLKIFEDINVIFGQKGTGKSEILLSLYNDAVKQGLKCAKYEGVLKEEGFKQILSISDMKRKCELLKIDNCEQEFSDLRNWEDVTVTLFTMYLKWFETKNNNANKRSMQITEASDLPLPDTTEYDQRKEDRKNSQDIEKRISSINIHQYLSESDASNLLLLLSKLDNVIYHSLLDAYGSIKTVSLSNYSVNKIKALADKKTDTVSRPSTTGFFEYAKKRIHIQKSVRKILSEFEKEEYHFDEKIGELEEKGDVYVRRRYRLLCNDSKTVEFVAGINNLKAVKNKLVEIRDKFYCSDIAVCIQELNELLNAGGIKSMSDFIGLSKLIVGADKQPYEPSNGERGILLLQQVIREDADAFFFDEPELGMGNSYIDSTIRPQLIDLAKRHKVVVIATHNANLAVRTLPYMSIFRKYDNGVYSTYTGNPFVDELYNIDDGADWLNWTEESMHTLEGGREAFYERKDIYESGND